jgi:hypothetical protein
MRAARANENVDLMRMGAAFVMSVHRAVGCYPMRPSISQSDRSRAKTQSGLVLEAKKY